MDLILAPKDKTTDDEKETMMMFRKIRHFFRKIRELFSRYLDRLAEIDKMLMKQGLPMFGHDAYRPAWA